MHCDNQYKNLRREVSLFRIVHKIRNTSLLLICQNTTYGRRQEKNSPSRFSRASFTGLKGNGTVNYAGY